MTTLPLEPNEAHLWYVRDDALDHATLTAWSAYLSQDERERRDRFLVAADRRHFVIGRALLRTLLSRYVDGVRPSDWRFIRNAWGRPSIAAPLTRDIHFNVSHTDGLVVCLLADSREVGVDAEAVDRQVRYMEIAEEHFAAPEIAALRALPEVGRADRFYDYWTLKEAYLKARGIGLSLQLDSFWFVLGDEVRLVCGARAADDARRWQFERIWLTPQHRVATAVERHAPGESIAFRVMNADDGQRAARSRIEWTSVNGSGACGDETECVRPRGLGAR